jgi:hypothetical protein
MNRKIMGFACMAVLGLALAVLPTSAGPILPKKNHIDFSSSTFPGPVQHPGGSVNFTEGFGNAFTVTNAPIYQLSAPHGPVQDGLYGVTDGKLSLTTGACMTSCNTIMGGFQGANFSGKGSSLLLTGEIASLGINSDETLIKGFFSNLGGNEPATHISLNKLPNPKHGTGGMTGYLEITYINPAIVDLLHLRFGQGEGELTQMYFNLNFLSGAKNWSGQVTSSDLNIVPTPEPTNLMLLGTALLAAAWITRRRVRA